MKEGSLYLNQSYFILFSVSAVVGMPPAICQAYQQP